MMDSILRIRPEKKICLVQFLTLVVSLLQIQTKKYQKIFLGPFFDFGWIFFRNPSQKKQILLDLVFDPRRRSVFTDPTQKRQTQNSLFNLVLIETCAHFY